MTSGWIINKINTTRRYNKLSFQKRRLLSHKLKNIAFFKIRVDYLNI